MDRVELEAKHMLNSYPIDLVDEDTDTDLPRLKIALISDFFYPRKGGAETHQYALGQELIRRGHKVSLNIIYYIYTLNQCVYQCHK